MTGPEPLSIDETRHVIDFLVMVAAVAGYAPDPVNEALAAFYGHDRYSFAELFDDAMIRADRLATSIGYPNAIAAFLYDDDIDNSEMAS